MVVVQKTECCLRRRLDQLPYTRTILAGWRNGRRRGLKIPRGVTPVRVRVPLRPLTSCVALPRISSRNGLSCKALRDGPSGRMSPGHKYLCIRLMASRRRPRSISTPRSKKFLRSERDNMLDSLPQWDLPVELDTAASLTLSPIAKMPGALH